MHPDVAAERVGEAHEYIANFITEHGKGRFSEAVRELQQGGSMSPSAREARDAQALAALVEILSNQSPDQGLAERVEKLEASAPSAGAAKKK